MLTFERGFVRQQILLQTLNMSIISRVQSTHFTIWNSIQEQNFGWDELWETELLLNWQSDSWATSPSVVDHIIQL